jgi:diguanylate cyclase (GGDEF)-like protein
MKAHPTRRPWPRRLIYPLCGALLAQLVPLGLLVGIRLAMHRLPSWTYLVNEIASEGITYHYVAIVSTVLLAGLGYLLGRRDDLLRERSFVDELTGIGNRHRLEAALDEGVGLATRYRLPVSLLRLDLVPPGPQGETDDRAASDEALRKVARCLARECRATDAPCHLDGDQFAVVLPGTSRNDAEKLAVRIRSGLAAEEQGPVAVAIGIADLASSSGRTVGDLCAAAELTLNQQ